MGFKADQLQEGTRFCSLTMVDVYKREAVAIEVGKSLGAHKSVSCLISALMRRACQGRANATYAPPDCLALLKGPIEVAPPAAITIYCLPFTM
jgi:hypothetical protein